MRWLHDVLDACHELLLNLRRQKWRSALTAFSVFWGVFMLLLLLGAGAGIQRGVLQDFGTAVLDTIELTPSNTSSPYQGFSSGRRVRFTHHDVIAIRHQFPEARLVSGVNIHDEKLLVRHAQRYGSFSVYGIADEFFRIKEDVPFPMGRKLNALDDDQTRKVVIIGNLVAARLFGTDVNPVGAELRLQDMALTVVGVFHDQSDFSLASERIYLPQRTYQKLFGKQNHIDSIWLRPKPGSDGFALETQVLALLKQRHHVAPDDHSGLRTFNMAGPVQDVLSLFSGIRSFIWLLGVGTLLAGVVSVSNVMIITIKERTREIGIRKAVGATPAAITLGLLTESVLLTSVAGGLGLLGAVLFLHAAALLIRLSGAVIPYFSEPSVDLHSGLIAIAVLVLAGMLAGLMPALHAARIAPIEAMRRD